MNIDLKKLNAIIPIVSCGTAFLWGQLGNAWNISWIAVPIGGMLMAILNILGKKDDGDKKP